MPFRSWPRNTKRFDVALRVVRDSQLKFHHLRTLSFSKSMSRSRWSFWHFFVRLPSRARALSPRQNPYLKTSSSFDRTQGHTDGHTWALHLTAAAVSSRRKNTNEWKQGSFTTPITDGIQNQQGIGVKESNPSTIDNRHHETCSFWHYKTLH